MSLRSGTLYTEVRINDCYTPVMISNSRIKIRSFCAVYTGLFEYADFQAPGKTSNTDNIP